MAEFKIGNQGRSANLVPSLAQQFGVDPNLIGFGTPELANQMRVNANAMRDQVEVSKSMLESIRIVTDCTAQLEALRKEAIECSIKRREEIEKMVSSLEVTIARHEQTIKKIAQDTDHGVRLAQRKGSLDIKSGKNRFKLELQAMRKKAVAQMRVDRQISKDKTSADVERIRAQPEEAKARSQERRDFNDFINGKTNTYSRPNRPMSALFN